MITKAIIFFFFLFTSVLYSQDSNERQQEREQRKNEIAQLEIEKSVVSELDAKKSIFSFFYDTKSEVRKLSMGLSGSEWEQIKFIQEEIWNSSVRLILENYSTIPHGYNRFLEDQYEMLLKYNDVIMDIAYSAMRQDLSVEAFSSISADAVFKVNSVAQRDF